MIKKILISDSQPISAYGIQHLINSLNYPVECLSVTANLKSICEFLNVYNPDLLIVDISIFEEKGIDVIMEIKAKNKFLKILVINTSYDKFLAIKSIKIGTNGFVTKADKLEVIKEAIERVLKGGVYIGKQLNDELSKA